MYGAPPLNLIGISRDVWAKYGEVVESGSIIDQLRI